MRRDVNLKFLVNSLGFQLDLLNFTWTLLNSLGDSLGLGIAFLV